MMADEVSGQITGGNGERVELRLGSKSLGITARDIVPILLLIIIGVSGYYVRMNLRDWIKSLEAQQYRLEQGLHQNREEILREVSGWRLAVEQQTAQIRRMLEVHQANTVREPENWLPLEFPPEQMPPMSGPAPSGR